MERTDFNTTREYQNYLRRLQNRKPETRKKLREYSRQYRETHREEKKKADKEYYERNRAERIAASTVVNKRSCKDPVVGDVCQYNTLIRRRLSHPDLYAGVVPRDCVVRPLIKGLDRETLELLEDKRQADLEAARLSVEKTEAEKNNEMM